MQDWLQLRRILFSKILGTCIIETCLYCKPLFGVSWRFGRYRVPARNYSIEDAAYGQKSVTCTFSMNINNRTFYFMLDRRVTSWSALPGLLTLGALPASGSLP